MSEIVMTTEAEVEDFTDELSDEGARYAGSAREPSLARQDATARAAAP